MVIESIVCLAQSWNLHTVTEFVANRAVLEAVKKLGVDCAQGYALHIPEPLVGIG